MLTLLSIAFGVFVVCSMLSYSSFTAKGGGHGAGIGNGLVGGMFMVFAVVSFLLTYVLGTISLYVYHHQIWGGILTAIPVLIILYFVFMNKFFPVK